MPFMANRQNHILLVDDSSLISQRVIEMFDDEPCVAEVANAATYEDAVQMLSRQNFHAVILDINIVGRNGIELLQYIRDTYPAIPVIMLTNQGGVHYRNLCESIGCTAYLDKSRDFEKLLPVISEIMDKNC